MRALDVAIALALALALPLGESARAAEDVVFKEEPVKALPPPPAGAKVQSFELRSLTPFFADGLLGQASDRLRSGDAGGAVRLLGELGSQPGGAASLQRDVHARFVLAVAQLRAGQGAGGERLALAQRAASHFDELSRSYPLLRSYHILYAGRAYLLANQPQLARERAQQVPSDSVLDCDARLLRAEAQQKLSSTEPPGPPPDRKPTARELAVRDYAAFLSACPQSGRRREAEVAQAELLEGLSRSSEALALWRRIYIEAPHESAGAQAAKRLEQPLGSGVKLAPFTATELVTRAQVLFDNMRNPESEAAYRWALEQPDLDDGQRCIARYHLAASVFKQRQRPRAAPLYDESVAACAPAAAKNDDLHMKGLYQAARCHASAGQLQQAADLFAAAEAAHPGHSYADDARLRQAEMYQDLFDRLRRDGAQKTCQAASCPDYEAKLTSLLGELPELYPAGDKRAEALWRLALRSLRRADLPAAQRWLELALAKLPHESGWDQEGRTLYWLGRVAELTGDGPAAVRAYSRAAHDYPLSYYTLLSLRRLQAGFAKDGEALLAELIKPPPGEPTTEEWSFAPRALFAQEPFLRGVELLRLGLGSEARREFQSIGIGVPEERGVAAGGISPEREELLWLAAVLFDRAGAWHLSHFIPRHVLSSWQRHYPVGAWRKHWLLAYPRGFAALLAAAARDSGQPEALQLAIVREESAFDPRTESFANAVGLTQMIPPTAKRFSSGLPYDRESLRDPAINVAIGGRFLGFLWQLWQQNPALAIPSYNAGEGAVGKWLRSFPQKLEGQPGSPPPDLAQIDLFVESIPYDETRGYTKRVLSSFLIYRWLYADEPPAARLPALPWVLPEAKPSVRAEPRNLGPKAPAEGGAG